MSTYNTFEELPVWQKSIELAECVFSLIEESSLKNEFELKRQIQKSVISVSSNIAEGFERGSKKEFIHFLYIAKGSCGELRSQLLLAKLLHNSPNKIILDMCDYACEVSRQINGFISYLKSTGFQGQKYQCQSI